MMPLRKTLSLSALLIFSASLQATSVSYIGNQDNVEAEVNDPTTGWRNPTPAKPFDIDGDNILGSDGYETFGGGGVASLPSYIANVTRLSSNNNNLGASAGLIDDPSDPLGADTVTYGIWHSGPSGTDIDIFSFEITGTELNGQTLRVGVLYDTFTQSGEQTYTLSQTTGGSAAATSGSQALESDGMDVLFFDLTDVSSGDVFTVSTSASSGRGHAGGVIFDTGVVSTTPPDAPTGLAAIPGDGQVELSWDASSGADSYNVKRSNSAGGSYSVVGSPTTNSFLDTTVSNGITYHYVV